MSKTKADTTEKKVTIRIPEYIHHQLVEAAKQDARSLNSEILILLRDTLKSRGA